MRIYREKWDGEDDCLVLTEWGSVVSESTLCGNFAITTFVEAVCIFEWLAALMSKSSRAWKALGVTGPLDDD